MAIVAIFRVPGMSVNEYERIMHGLQVKGQAAPAGRRHHIAAPMDGGWLVVDVWDDEDHLRRFSEVLVPTIEEAGVVPPRPEIYPVHNLLSAPAR